MKDKADLEVKKNMQKTKNVSERDALETLKKLCTGSI